MFCGVSTLLFLYWSIILQISADTILVKLDGGNQNQFDNVKKIGQGSNGVVYEGEWAEQNGKLVAVKISLFEEGDNDILNEVRLYEHIGILIGNSESEAHSVAAPILEFYGSGSVTRFMLDTTCSDIVYQSQANLVNRKVMIMESVGLNLDQATMEKDGKTRVNLSPTEWLQIGLEMLQAVQFLHTNSIIHGDIKPENFALREGRTLCILDFGCARLIIEEFKGIGGSLLYNSFHLMNQVLQKLECLPEDIEILKQEPGVKDDLESFLMSFHDIKVPLDWDNYISTFYEYVRISELDIPEQQMSPHELEAFHRKEEEREDRMKEALLNALTSKEKFPDQIQSKIGKVLRQTSHLERLVQDAIYLFGEIITYARAQAVLYEQNVAKEKNFMSRLTVILESWKKTQSEKSSRLEPKTKGLQPVDVPVTV